MGTGPPQTCSCHRVHGPGASSGFPSEISLRHANASFAWTCAKHFRESRSRTRPDGTFRTTHAISRANPRRIFISPAWELSDTKTTHSVRCDSIATPDKAVPIAAIAFAAFTAHNLPDGVEPNQIERRELTIGATMNGWEKTDAEEVQSASSAAEDGDDASQARLTRREERGEEHVPIAVNLT